MPTPAFFDCFYKKLGEKKERANQDWLAGKQRQTAWLEQHLLNLSLKDTPSLSVGAGMGVVERPLLDKGFNIHLQECQPTSLVQANLDHVTTCYRGALSHIPDASYDFCFAVTVTYALGDQSFKEMLCDITRILRPKGSLLLLDPAPSWKEGERLLKDRIKRRSPEGVLWGYKRSLSFWRTCAKSFGLHMKLSSYFDECMQPFCPREFLGMPIHPRAHWQEALFQKK